MTAPCTFNENDHPRFPHGQFAPKRNDSPAGELTPPAPLEVTIVAAFAADGAGYRIEQSSEGYRWSWGEPEHETETGAWLPAQGDAIIDAWADWEHNGIEKPSPWVRDMQRAAITEQRERDRAEEAARRALAARVRDAGRTTPARGPGLIATEAQALLRDARLVGEGAIDDLAGYAGAVFD